MKLPNSAQKKFSGVLFDVYQWDQEQFDKSTATYECVRRCDSVQVIPILDDGRIVLSYEQQPTMEHAQYGFVGGFIEREEEGRHLEAAKRELLEETGMEAKDWQLLAVIPYGHKVVWDTYIYVARDCKKIGEQHLDPGERIDIKEVYYDRFCEIVTDKDFRARMLMVDMLMELAEKKKTALKAALHLE